MEKKKIINQIALQEKIQRMSSVNIVNCGNCGCVVLHEMQDAEIDCPYCDIIMEKCHCPDFLYSGIENNEQFQ
jgi:hypothetical protein